MSDAEKNLERKQAHARAHKVRCRILELFPTERGEAPTASKVFELLKDEFPNLTVPKANYHLATLRDADLLPSPHHRAEQDTQLARGIGAAVQELREERGISLEDLAHRAQLPISDVVAIEDGSAEEFWGDLRRLASALGIALESLIKLGEQLADPIDRGGKGGAKPDDADPDEPPQPES